MLVLHSRSILGAQLVVFASKPTRGGDRQTAAKVFDYLLTCEAKQERELIDQSLCLLVIHAAIHRPYKRPALRNCCSTTVGGLGCCGPGQQGIGVGLHH
jgi:hypothetical protein